MTPAERIYEDLAKSHKGAKPWPALDSDFGRWMMQILTNHCERLLREKKAVKSEIADEIYEAYPRKEGRGAAIQAIVKQLKAHDAEMMLAKTKEYAAAVAQWGRLYRYNQTTNQDMVPHPSTWFNQERFLDDPTNWQRKGGKPAPRVVSFALDKPEGFDEWFRVHYDSEPRKWPEMDDSSKAYYLKMMQDTGGMKRPDAVTADDVARVLGVHLTATVKEVEGEMKLRTA